MLSTGYPPYIWIAGLLFVVPILVSWSRTLHIFCCWVLIRPTSGPWISQRLVAQPSEVGQDPDDEEGPLDRLYRMQQQEQQKMQQQLQLPASTSLRTQRGSASSEQPHHDTSVAESSTIIQSQQAVQASPEGDATDEPVAISLDRRALTSSTDVEFSCQLQVWDPHISQYLAWLISIVGLDLLIMVFTTFNMIMASRYTYWNIPPMYR